MVNFPNKSRVCFIGDSLVASNMHLSRIVDYYCKHFPENEIEFFNCGTSGGNYRSPINFFYDDVLSHNPTHAVVAFGINDSSRTFLADPRSEKRSEILHNAYENYMKNLAECCELLRKHNIEVILCTPAPYDEYSPKNSDAFKGGYALMLGYSEFVRKYASENNIPVCDYNAYLSKKLETDEKAIYSDDRVHPNEYGYYLLANCFIEFMGHTPDEEAPIPDYLAEWHKTVRRLRVIFGTEHMIIKNYSMPYEEKMKNMQDKIAKSDWGAPVFEGFIRGFVAEKPNQEKLYKEIDDLYKMDIIHHYK